jgi:serine/threonine-protein kinase
MELVPGADAETTAGIAKPMPVARAVGWAVQALEALAYAHDRGFVHRDVKPSNVLVAARPGGGDVVKLAGLGLTQAFEDWVPSGLTLSAPTGVSPFTPPEQVAGVRSAKPAADQYAAAATLYRLLSGHDVHPASASAAELLTRILQSDPEPVTAYRPDLPEGLAAAIHRALAREATARFPDCRAFAAVLRPFAG